MNAELPQVWVLLRHDGSPEGVHFDWMLQPPGPSETPLLSFRVAVRVDGMGEGGFEAERVADHRAAYLTYEGPISGGRGRVRRVASGRWRAAAVAPDELRGLLAVEFSDERPDGSLLPTVRFRGAVERGNWWRFELHPEP